MTVDNRFGTLLKRYRQAADLSQEALAARADLSARAISDLERGINHAPRSDTLRRLMSALSLPEPQQALLRAAAHPVGVSAPEVTQHPSSFHHLPLALPLVGRAEERSHALALLRGADVRLLTITGPSGVGKTRLGLQIARDLADDFSDGVAYVPLAPVHDATLVPAVIGERLHLSEQVERSMEEQVHSFLQPRQFLLVLDNFEHLLGAAPFVADLLANCPRLQVLVTSRAPLRLRPEQVFPLVPLALDDAITLFRVRAQAVRPGRAYEGTTVAAICEQVDCLPLAIELAAMQVRLLSLKELLERLSTRLALLGEGARDLPARQRTMRNAIEEQQEATLGLRLAGAFGQMWFSHGYLREAEMWLERMLALDWQAVEPEAVLVLRGSPQHFRRRSPGSREVGASRSAGDRIPGTREASWRSERYEHSLDRAGNGRQGTRQA